MIDFRYHLISIVAIFLALAVGIALGAGPLQTPLTEGLVSQASQDRADEEQLRAELRRLQDRIAFDDSYAAGTADAVRGNALAGRTVSVVPLPGADSADVRALREQVSAARGIVVSTVPLTSTLLDPAERTLAQGLAQSLLDRVEGYRAPPGAASYELFGAAFARAFLTRGASALAQDDDADTIEAAMVEAELITVDGKVDRRAQLALVVAGDPPEDVVEGQPDVAAEIAAAMDAGSVGAVVAGTPGSAEDGVVAAVRDSGSGDEVSTVDAVRIPAGRIVTVLAVAEQARGGVGHYGRSTAEDGAVPELPR